MLPQPLTRLPLVPQWPATSSGLLGDAGGSPWNATREAWVTAFSGRFLELRPLEDEEVVRELAADLWTDVGGHDPVIAAEMEHEATLGD